MFFLSLTDDLQGFAQPHIWGMGKKKEYRCTPTLLTLNLIL